MAGWSVDQEYEKLVEDSVLKGEIPARGKHAELRASPRFRMEDGRLVVRVEPEFQLVDVSATGLAFLSERQFERETRLAIIVKGAVTVQAVVLGCTMTEVDSLMMDMRYRVQCRFDSEAEGKQMLLLLKELEREHKAQEAP